jgi:acid stress-induced BolA-like protein IbaG/YrbA
MAAKKLLTKVRQALKQRAFGDQDDLVDVSEASDGSIHIVVVSRKLDGKRLNERQAMLWDELMARLSESEWSQISLAIARSPEEIKAL